MAGATATSDARAFGDARSLARSRRLVLRAEIVYRGPTVMHGYYGDREATAQAFAGGRYGSPACGTSTRTV
jgi:long-subunit acyl-CoA synthetase (AMP-forming)